MEVVSRTATPVVFVVLARLLTPADYGIMATASIVIAFSQMFWDAGLSKALIQAKEDPEQAAQVVFWTNTALGIAIYVALVVSAPAVASFFDSPKSAPVLRVLGLQVVIASLSSVQQALFLRDMNFKRLFWIRLASAFVPGLFSIPMAFFGQGVWALVAGSLAGQTMNLVMLWRSSSWRPRWGYDQTQARRLFRFGSWVMLEAFGAWLIQWGDNLIVGRCLGVHDLGVYRTGVMLINVIFGLVLNPFVPVVYPIFSRLQDQHEELCKTFHRVNRLVLAIAIPVGVGVFLVGPEIATALFGVKWAGLGFVLSCLGLMNGVAWLVGLNSELYRAMGRPDVNTKLMYFQLLYFLPAFYFSAQYGLKAFACTRFLVALAATPIHIWLCRRMLRVPWSYLWVEGRPMFMATGAMLAVVGCLRAGLIQFPAVSSKPLLALLVCAGAVTYAGALWILDRSFVLQSRSLLVRSGK